MRKVKAGNEDTQEIGINFLFQFQDLLGLFLGGCSAGWKLLGWDEKEFKQHLT